MLVFQKQCQTINRQVSFVAQYMFSESRSHLYCHGFNFHLFKKKKKRINK